MFISAIGLVLESLDQRLEFFLVVVLLPWWFLDYARKILVVVILLVTFACTELCFRCCFSTTSLRRFHHPVG
jgi:hypothetical protein